jgi:hypothetical protein
MNAGEQNWRYVRTALGIVIAGVVVFALEKYVWTRDIDWKRLLLIAVAAGGGLGYGWDYIVSNLRANLRRGARSLLVAVLLGLLAGIAGASVSLPILWWNDSITAAALAGGVAIGFITGANTIYEKVQKRQPLRTAWTEDGILVLFWAGLGAGLGALARSRSMPIDEWRWVGVLATVGVLLFLCADVPDPRSSSGEATSGERATEEQDAD